MERLEFGKGGSLGPKWVFPVGKFETKPYSRETLTKKIGTPEFCPKAKIEVKKGTKRTEGTKGTGDVVSVSSVASVPSIIIKIPMADDDPQKRFFKSVYFSGVNAGVGHEPDGGVTTVEIPMSLLPEGRKFTIAIRPVSSLGTKGKAIGATLRV